MEHVAAELDRPLVAKRASDLLSKWLGESEQNIAAAFEEAAAEEAILFFDEGDSFLRSRELARHSWEVTQTNELLQHMERFDGIVIVATNLFRDLDIAALRSSWNSASSTPRSAGRCSSRRRGSSAKSIRSIQIPGRAGKSGSSSCRCSRPAISLR
ncbi:MAG TPA: ATP-binding protein [Steroidobacteraceae bacterium]|nr:ATP-binding protein [Steroidobacteraceae bacterium]